MKFLARNKGILISLTAICTLAFVLRSLSFHTVFGNDYVAFLEVDAYNRMLYARMLHGMTPLEAITFALQNNLLFPYLVATLGHVFPIEYVGAWLPPVLAVGAIVGVYFIGYLLAGPAIGLLAAMFTAIIPSEFLHRTLLGFADHHAMEAFLLVTSVLLIIKLIKTLAKKYYVLAGVSLFLYMANWVSGMYLAGLLLGVAAMVFFIHNLATRKPWHTALPALVIPLAIALAIYLPLGGYARLLWFVPSSAGNVSAQATGEIVTTVLAPPGSRTISEIMPLLFPYGTFNLGVVITNLHLFAITFVAGIAISWKYRHDKAVLLTIVWTAVMLVITFNQRRFMYYLTFNVAIMSAVAISFIAKHIKGNAYTNAILLTIPLLVFSMPTARMVASYQPFAMTPEWHSALVWLKAQPASGNVTAWGDYGHWIQYVSGKTPNYMPGPGGDLAAQLLLTTDDEKAKDLMSRMETGYVIVDQATMTTKWHALVVYAGFDTFDRQVALGNRLLAGRAPPYLQLAYESNTIKIFKYTPNG